MVNIETWFSFYVPRNILINCWLLSSSLSILQLIEWLASCHPLAFLISSVTFIEFWDSWHLYLDSLHVYRGHCSASESHDGIICRSSPLSHLGPIQGLVLEAAFVLALLQGGAITHLGLGRRSWRRHFGYLLWLGQGRRRLLLDGGDIGVVIDGLQLRDGGKLGRVVIGQTPGRGGASLKIIGLDPVQRLDSTFFAKYA